jgi:hypothetical protein
MAAAILSAPAPKPAPIAAADPIEDDPPVAPTKPQKKKVKIKDEDDGSKVAANVETDPGGGGENKLLQLKLGAGTQALSAYTVAVGGTVTGLAYTLSPLMMINAGAALTVPDVNVGGEIDLTFVPVKYAIDVDPAVSPAEPAGRFFNVGVNGFYKLELARFGAEEEGRFHLVPMLGLNYGSMTAESQGENTVVVSWSAVDIGAGAKANVQVNEQIALSAFVRGGLVVSYSEGPTTTGDGGGGINLAVGANARYWVSDAFGIFLRTIYTYQRIGLDGTGTRTPFVDDPPLESATVFSGDLKIGTGVLLAI